MCVEGTEMIVAENCQTRKYERSGLWTGDRRRRVDNVEH
jgi:hypothetical protein